MMHPSILPLLLVIASTTINTSQLPYTLKLENIITGYNDSDGMLNTPYGAVIDSNGRIIVTDNLNNRVQVFDSNGNFLFKFGIPGYDPGGFTHPSGVTVNSNGDIVVADLHNYRIQVFDSNGVYKFQFGKPSSYDGQFTYPISVAVDSNDRIIVADTYMHRIQVFDSNGNFLFKFGKEGSGDGEFSFPTGIAVDSNDRIIVADVWNNRIQVFDSNGNFLFKFGKEGSGDGEFMFPNGVAVDRYGNIIIADTFNNRIQVFDSNGNFLFKFGKEGSGDGEFSFPTGIAVHGDKLVVVDTGNNRVQVFKLIVGETELSNDELRSRSSLQLLDGNDGTIDVGESVKTVVYSSMSDGNARFIWIRPDGSIARDTIKNLSNGTVEDEFTPSIEGVWRVEVELSNGSGKVERLNAIVTVVPEFPSALPILAGIIAFALLFYRRVEKTKFT
ncbi:MAG: 6-bladed beta-propeller [Candidatus Nitrosocaldus sp.]